jgi:hypothetical protein
MALGGSYASKQNVVIGAVLFMFLWYLGFNSQANPPATSVVSQIDVQVVSSYHHMSTNEANMSSTHAQGKTDTLQVDSSQHDGPLELDASIPQGQPDLPLLPTKPAKPPANPYITEGQLNPSGRLSKGPLSPPADDPWRPLILYAFSDSPVSRDNLRFFLHHGLHAAADFIFILNGMTNETAKDLLIPEGASNIRTIYRPNTCYDLGAYGEVLRGDKVPLGMGPGRLELYRRYKRFVLLNSSVRGPFLPHWGRGACWSDIFLAKVDVRTKLVGMTASCWPHFHVQSEVWATDFVGMELLMHPPPPPPPGPDGTDNIDTFAGRDEPVGLSGCYPDLNKALHAELGATRVMLAAGHRVDLLMSAYHGIANYSAVCDPDTRGDMLWNNKYFGTNVHPYETVFAKTNRDVDPVLIDRLTEWQWNSGWRSWDSCGAWSTW